MSLMSSPMNNATYPFPSTPPFSQILSTDTPSSVPASAAQSSSPLVATTTLVDSLPEDQTKEHIAHSLAGIGYQEHHCHSLKCSFELALPSDQGHRRPKRAKKIFTTLIDQVSAKRENIIEDLHTLQMLQLAHASRQAFAARVKYRLTCIHELDVMRTVAHDKYEEAITHLNKVDLQVGEMRHFLVTNGTSITSLSALKLSPVPSISDSESSVASVLHDHAPSATSTHPDS
ncbi:hypothetical protein JVT61DRAFT_11467 [Boletus reticuloceps]|uniref:Uncharacterized protein n=1 Tax=Boletus reticuloceps TaxID=495285 RepID=A0A8I3AD34_9AGAM|nr:hypothetical protein JVT61DRAFT_11467 [Boletus reticuloceps]